jgi:hypothetical protein
MRRTMRRRPYHRYVVRFGIDAVRAWHCPFENATTFAEQFPADFIAEGVDQTRGWFYSLLAIATGLGDALPNNATKRIRVARIARSS